MAGSSDSQFTFLVALAFYTSAEQVWDCSMEIPIPPPEPC
jgi:hypothetical protein